jgi:transposase-like protein
MTTAGRYPPEIRERAVRLVFEHEQDYPSQWAAIRSIGEKSGMTVETLRQWFARLNVTRAEGMAPRPRTATACASSNGKSGAAARQRDPQGRRPFLRGGARPPTWQMIAFSTTTKPAGGSSR